MPKLKSFEVDKYSTDYIKENKQKPHKFKDKINNNKSYDKTRRSSNNK